MPFGTVIASGRWFDGAIEVRLGGLGTHALPQDTIHEIIDNAAHFMHPDQHRAVHQLLNEYVAG